MADQSIQNKANSYADSIIKVPKNGIELVHKKMLIDAYIAGVSQIMAPELKELITNTKSEFDALERIQQHEDYENKTKDEWEMMTTIFVNLAKIYETLKPLI